MDRTAIEKFYNSRYWREAIPFTMAQLASRCEISAKSARQLLQVSLKESIRKISGTNGQVLYQRDLGTGALLAKPWRTTSEEFPFDYQRFNPRFC